MSGIAFSVGTSRRVYSEYRIVHVMIQIFYNPIGWVTLRKTLSERRADERSCSFAFFCFAPSNWWVWSSKHSEYYSVIIRSLPLRCRCSQSRIPVLLKVKNSSKIHLYRRQALRSLPLVGLRHCVVSVRKACNICFSQFCLPNRQATLSRKTTLSIGWLGRNWLGRNYFMKRMR